MIDVLLEAEALRQNLERAPTMTAHDLMVEDTLRAVARRAFDEGRDTDRFKENPYE